MPNRVSGGHGSAWCGLLRVQRVWIKGEQPCRTGGEPVHQGRCPPTLLFLLPSKKDFFSIWEVNLPVFRVLNASPASEGRCWVCSRWMTPAPNLETGLVCWVEYCSFKSHVHTAGTWECDLIWKESLCRCDLVSMRLYWSRVSPKSNMTDVLIRRGKVGSRHTEEKAM